MKEMIRHEAVKFARQCPRPMFVEDAKLAIELGVAIAIDYSQKHIRKSRLHLKANRKKNLGF